MSKLKFDGTIGDLIRIVETLGIPGEWDLDKHKHQCVFRTYAGGILNWWPNGTINFQGIEPAKSELARAYIFTPKPYGLKQDPTNSGTTNKYVVAWEERCRVKAFIAAASPAVAIEMVKTGKYAKIIQEKDDIGQPIEGSYQCLGEMKGGRFVKCDNLHSS